MQEPKDMRDRLLREFTEKYAEKLFYFCLKRTGSAVDAEDLTQEIALEIIAMLQKGSMPTRFSAWVWQIARNRYALWAKEKRRRSEMQSASDIGDLEIADESENILDEMIRSEQMALLRRELAFIKSDYRNIVLAYYVEDRSVSEIASALSLSKDAVWQRLHRARMTLKEGMNMAREFGKLSYKPEDIWFITNGIFGGKGEPWNFLSRSLCKNILLAAYRTPSTAEELAMEVGVALPYMEEELSALVDATLMKKNGDRYETSLFIVSRVAQEKIYAHLREIAPSLTQAIARANEFEIDWKNENCPAWHGGYQPLEDAKWALLMYQTDVVNFDTLDAYYQRAGKPSTENLGSWGHTRRPNGGEWDVLGLEIGASAPAFVGLHGCVNTPTDRDLPEIGFQQFKFKYRNIEAKTPDFMPYAYAEALVSIAKDKGETVEPSVLAYLEKNGYIRRTDGAYEPTFLVMFKDKRKAMPQEAETELERLRREASEIAMQHYLFCREQICREIPGFLKDDRHAIDHAVANIFALRGAVLEEALRQGYLTYRENDGTRMLGTFLRI